MNSQNRYIFIIWDKALFLKDKILKDISESFCVEKHFYVEWTKHNFDKNLQAFYGSKMDNVKLKRNAIGTGKFLIILVKEKENNVDTNKNIYDKKCLYRKWTAGNFRVHSSISNYETIHDLTILLGPNYDEIINNIENEDTICVDTCGLLPFGNVDDFIKTITNVSDSIVLENKETLYIFSKEKENVSYLLGKSNNISINNSFENVVLFGEQEDLPRNFINCLKEHTSLKEGFFNVLNDYLLFIQNKQINNSVKELFNKYGFDERTCFVKNVQKNRANIFNYIKNQIKYSIIKTNNK